MVVWLKLARKLPFVIYYQYQHVSYDKTYIRPDNTCPIITHTIFSHHKQENISRITSCDKNRYYTKPNKKKKKLKVFHPLLSPYHNVRSFFFCNLSSIGAFFFLSPFLSFLSLEDFIFYNIPI